MSRRIPSYMLLLLFTLIFTVTAAPLSSSRSIDSFVPSCATQCFDSFLSISYADRPARTLAALCPRIGAYGFTIGEAAVQCLAAERAAGACSEQVVSDAVIDQAYFMCYGQPAALSPTHTVITATLAVPLFGTGPITFPPVTKTSDETAIPTAIPRETQSSLSLPTTLVTDPTSLSSARSSTARPTSRSRSTATSTTVSTTRPSPTSFKSSTSSSADVLTTEPVATTFTGTSTPTAEASSTGVPSSISGGQGEKKTPASLSTGQVAGIAIGCITGAGFVGLGIAVFCRCLRKRRSRFGRQMRKDGRPLGDSWGYGPEKGPNGGGGGTDSWIANQLRAPLEPGPVPPPTKSWYNRASWRPSAIGLAISPGHARGASPAATPTSARPLSKLLPAKPVMDQGPPKLQVSLPSRDGDAHFGAAALMGAAAAGMSSGAVMSGAIAASSPPKPAARPAVPPATREPAVVARPSIQPRNLTPRSKPQPPSPLKLIIPKTGNLKPFVPVVTRHDSSTTEFEEDGRASLSPGGQIWRPPPADPLTAATYYVADRSGNWRLGDPARALEIAELEASISPLTAAPRSAAPKLVAGLGLATGPAGALALVKAASKRQADRAASAAKAAEQSRQSALGIVMPPEKTIRAVEPSISSDEDIQEQEQQPYAPRPLFSGNGNASSFPRRSSTHRRSSTRSLTRRQIGSTDSGVTAFSTSTDDTDSRSPPPLEQSDNLSPVVESPRLTRRRSPTLYPKIPASLDAAMPSSPGKSNSGVTAAKAGNATGLPKPTMGDRPAQPSPSFGAPLAAGTMSSYGNMPTKRQGSKVAAPRAAEAPDAVRTSSPMRRVQGPAPRPDEGYDRGQRSQAPQQANPPAQPNASLRTYPPQKHQQYPAPAYQGPPSNNYSMPTSTTTAASALSTDSQSSSLLAKRLGTSRAANMAIPVPQSGPSSAQSKWLRQQGGEPSTPKMMLPPDLPTELPATPVWKPRLTPTRRGDDLFLIAQ
ncbi:hypothetical protein Trco_002860 [Trichoderma cornu-damae]|uniref:Extracellular membrane protein CFEM domain-containing protein n=1 Tax=Trichoderma cornu-damae TaxID=654480 RepID=A0A9P8TY76_9HYPO|nr:hypothetical protein Trco_002860 [Trichoderma cornu-damae]